MRSPVNDNVWIAWQFHQPDTGQGVVHAFRRENCSSESATLKLRGLDRTTVYTITDMDATESRHINRSTLMDSGLAIATSAKPAAVVIT